MTDTPRTTPLRLADQPVNDAQPSDKRISERRVIATVSAAHFVSHYYTLILAPLFAFVRADYGVTYTELGIALAAYNLVSGALQTPAGFLVDRIGARNVLVAGLTIGAVAFAVVGMVDSFPVLVAMFALAGVGNTVYHPADYTILSQQVRPARAAQAFSIHTFAGMLGSALAPTTLVLLQGAIGWRGAFLTAAFVGLAVAGVIALQRDATPAPAKPNREADSDAPVGWPLLLSPVILLNLAYFALMSFGSAGMQNFTVVGLDALFGTPFGVASSGLTAYLMLTALGVLAGGFFAGRMTHHALPVVAGMTAVAACAVTIGLGPRRRRPHAGARPRRLHDGLPDAVARPDRARGHAPRLVRQGVRLRVDRAERRMGGGAARVRPADGPRASASRVHGDRGELRARDPDRAVRQPAPALTPGRASSERSPRTRIPSPARRG
jgi:MFS family permease